MTDGNTLLTNVGKNSIIHTSLGVLVTLQNITANNGIVKQNKNTVYVKAMKARLNNKTPTDNRASKEAIMRLQKSLEDFNLIDLKGNTSMSGVEKKEIFQSYQKVIETRNNQ